MNEIVPKKSLSDCLAALEALCHQIDDAAAEIPEDLIAAFVDAKQALAVKVDNWIQFRDVAKKHVELLKERKDRAAHDYKVATNVQNRLESYLLYLIKQNPSLPFKGSEHTIYARNNPKALKLKFKTQDKSVADTVDDLTLAGLPGLGPYTKQVSYRVVDKAKLKADIEAGMNLHFAEVTQGARLEIKG